MTSLERQLKRLKTPQTEEFRQTRYRVSFLYDKKEAAAIDCDTHLRIANRGFKKLAKLNPDLLEFKDLFSEQSKEVERSTLHKEENNELSSSIRKFIHNSVVPFFMLNDCHETLEYLIYKFYVHTYQADDLLCALLPYHETRLFARALQVIELSDSSYWAWLEPYKKDGVPVPKEKIIAIIASKPPLVSLLGDKLIEINRDSNKANIFTSFYTTTMMCVLDRDLNEQFYVTFLAHVYKAIKKSNNSSLFMACLVLVGYLAYTQDLEETYVKRLEARLRKSHGKLCEKDSSSQLVKEYFGKVLKLIDQKH
jgi:U3 small nucleolar RNA-associated protein 10